MKNGLEQLLNVEKWHCPHCIRSFDSRGKRDEHYRKEHQKECQTVTLVDENQSIQRARQGKFACHCGKEFWRAQSLQRHCKGCIDSILIIEDDLESTEHEERNSPTPDVIAARQLEEQWLQVEVILLHMNFK